MSRQYARTVLITKLKDRIPGNAKQAMTTIVWDGSKKESAGKKYRKVIMHKLACTESTRTPASGERTVTLAELSARPCK